MAQQPEGDERALVRALRAWAATGDPGALAGRYRGDAVLDALVPGRRAHCEGIGAVRAELESWWSGPAEVVELTVDQTPEGTVSVEVERHPTNDEPPSRLAHVLHLAEGRIARHLVMCSQPRALPPPDLPLPLPSSEVVSRRIHPRGGASGSLVETVETTSGRFVVKHCAPGRDWLMRATHDRGREAGLFLDGVLADVPASVLVPVVGAEAVADGWVVVMRDVSDHLLGADGRMTRAEARRLFAALTDLHRRFEGRELPHALADLRERIGVASSGVAAAELGGQDWLPKWFQRSWELVDDLLPDDVAALLRAIDRDPGPLADALLARGRTLLHGDAGPSNVGFTEDRVVLLDWQLASAGPGVVDLVVLLNHGYRVEATHDELLDDIRTATGNDHDEHTLQLALLAHLPMAYALSAASAVEDVDPQWRADAVAALDWWVGAARHAARYTRWA